MAWSASPARQTLPLQIPPQRRSLGHRYLKGEETMALGSAIDGGATYPSVRPRR
ncbi:unnamed protein product [Spirodela intermedia]|uniref:Uncharacterized protein n=1 Tax=Spirodela intermedia TaxID=51605 RepID=A0A7I8IF55_SPIIN|nr:unnamed protein product [Spirodela intermedia]CAA6656015.1 unnamed protein product [Spirodela intermedia]